MFASLTGFLLRLKSLVRRKRMDRELADELEFHQALMQEKLVRQGVPQSRAAYEVRRSFGNPARWQERLREVWQLRQLEHLSRDVAFSLRLLKKSPGFTAIALTTLALGVGANTAVFSLINGLLLRPLPVPHSGQLALLGIHIDSPNARYKLNYSFPAPLFRGLESQHEIFSSVVAFSRAKLLIRGRSGNENVEGVLVSGQYFNALQTPPLLGRYLTPDDDVAGGSPQGIAIVISESFWQSWFNRAPEVLGSRVTIANSAFAVVGVMPKRFIGADPTQRPQIFVPLSAEPIIDAPESMIEAGMHGWWLTVMGRLQDQVTLAQANAALKPMSNPLLQASGVNANELGRLTNRHFLFMAESGSQGFTQLRLFFQKPLIALFSMCGGILLLACMNLASLLMARSAARERELATRLAMGATRRRLMQQLLVESLLVCLAGTALGLGIAPLVSQAIATTLLSASGRSVYLDTSIDLRVLAFSAIAACASTLLIGLIPAWLATSGTLNEQIKDSQHVTQDRRKILPRVLLASEVGLALLLVVGAGLLATSLMRLANSALGFNPKGVIHIEFDMDKQPLDGEALQRVYQQIGEALSHLPGAESISFTRIIPLTGTAWDQDFHRPGGTSQDLFLNATGTGYFDTMRIPMLAGRDFNRNDTLTSGLKIILNQSAAKLLFPSQNPLGQHLFQDKTDYEVIAVVGDTKYTDLRSPAPAAAYLPIAQVDREKPSYSAVVRWNGSEELLASSARNLAARLAPDIPPPAITSMERVAEDSISSERVMAMLSLFFAGCALLVTGIGLYGTLAYSTARRTSEIGIRMALGAQRAGVVALVFRENAVVALAGCAAGLVSAIFGSRILATFLYETSPRDPVILFGSAAALAAIASAASLLPAIRAARIEPISAIRCE